MYEFLQWRHTLEIYSLVLIFIQAQHHLTWHVFIHLSLIHSFFFQQVTYPVSPFFRPHNGHVTIVVNNRVSASRNLDFHIYFKRNIPLSGNVLSPVRTLSIQWVFIESDYLKVNISSKFHIICKCKRKYYLRRHFQKQTMWFPAITVHKHFSSENQIWFLDSLSLYWFWIPSASLINFQFN